MRCVFVLAVLAVLAVPLVAADWEVLQVGWLVGGWGFVVCVCLYCDRDCILQCSCANLMEHACIVHVCGYIHLKVCVWVCMCGYFCVLMCVYVCKSQCMNAFVCLVCVNASSETCMTACML